MMELNNIPHGDMPGDQIKIEKEHVEKAKLIYSYLKPWLDDRWNNDPDKKIVLAVCGGSGVGKSEIASLIAYLLQQDKIKAYVLSGDNYPHRIPVDNDAKREAVYEEGGREALAAYLGSDQEIDFSLVNRIIQEFKKGASHIELKRMGRTKEEKWFEDVDMTQVKVMIIEWTHSNSNHIEGVDYPILLNSTPEETLEHRKKRNRDGGVDSPFTALVLELEQQMLMEQAHKAKLIVTKKGKVITYDELQQMM